MSDVQRVGGKNASLGELLGQLSELGLRVPDGFATTADGYREFLAQDGLAGRIDRELSGLDVADVGQLSRSGGRIRSWIRGTPLPVALREQVTAAWHAMAKGHEGELALAVRSSATAEDLPEASFAGQQETFLNIRGLPRLLEAIHHVFASLYNDRAISYRVHHAFDHKLVALSAGVQHMVRSDLGASGVAFTLDTESGFRDVVLITSSWGLGETVVQGAVNPDEFYVYKPGLRAKKQAILRRQIGTKRVRMVYSDTNELGRTVRTEEVEPAQSAQFSLTDADVEALSRQALIIEEHYGGPRRSRAAVATPCCDTGSSSARRCSYRAGALASASAPARRASSTARPK
jgi:pyruvate,water dikinase